MRPVAEQPAEDQLTVADALVLALRGWGVDTVFGVSGANIEDFHDAIYRRGAGELTSVAARSESGAAFMADAQARAGSPMGVCCSTSGGGMMNLAVGVAESYQEGIPVLAIVGQIPTPFNGVGGFQDSSGLGHTVDAQGMWRAISKHVGVIDDPNTFWADLKAAVTAIMSPRKGPAVLLVAKDVFKRVVPPCPSDWPVTLADFQERQTPSPTQLQAFRNRLARAKAPVMILGPEVRASKAREEMITVARLTQTPVVTTLSDVAVFPSEDPLYLGVVGTAGHPSAHQYVNNEADLVIVVGSHMEFMQRAPIIPGLQRADLMFVNAELSLSRRTFPEGVMLECDIGALARGLLCDTPVLPVGRGRPQGYRCQEYVPLLAERTEVDDGDVDEDALLQSDAIGRIQDILPRYQRLIFDAGNCAASSLHYLSMPEHLETSIALGMGGMGYAIPAAIGASFSGPDMGRTIVLCGDGAFLILGMEVHTAVDLGLPILFVVFNNAKHGMCVTRQQVYFDSRIECASYRGASIAELSRGFGRGDQIWVGEASTLAELDAALDDLGDWAWSGPAVLELTLRREEIPPFAPFLPAGAPVADKRLTVGVTSSPRQPRAA